MRLFFSGEGLAHHARGVDWHQETPHNPSPCSFTSVFFALITRPSFAFVAGSISHCFQGPSIGLSHTHTVEHQMFLALTTTGTILLHHTPDPIPNEASCRLAWLINMAEPVLAKVAQSLYSCTQICVSRHRRFPHPLVRLRGWKKKAAA